MAADLNSPDNITKQRKDLSSFGRLATETGSVYDNVAEIDFEPTNGKANLEKALQYVQNYVQTKTGTTDIVFDNGTGTDQVWKNGKMDVFVTRALSQDDIDRMVRANTILTGKYLPRPEVNPKTGNLEVSSMWYLVTGGTIHTTLNDTMDILLAKYNPQVEILQYSYGLEVSARDLDLVKIFNLIDPNYIAKVSKNKIIAGTTVIPTGLYFKP